MSNASGVAVVETCFDADDEWQRIERAVNETDCESPAEFVREGALRLVDEVLDEDGRLECPHDDCNRMFATIRERRGHLGSGEHALDVPDGDFWCGYCGYGPTSWHGVNAHHGQSDHDGKPVRLGEQPDRDELLTPDDIPDHKNPDLLARLYREHDGNYTAMCRAHDFDVTPGRVRHYLIEFGIHEPTPQGAIEDGDGPHYRDPDWLRERYDAVDGNVSEMYRQIEIDVPYRTLLKNLKRLGIHDPEESPGRSQAWDRREDDQDEDGTSEPAVDDAADEFTGLDHTDPDDLQAAFDEYDTISDAAEAFPEVTYATVRQRMIDHGIYTPQSYDNGQNRSAETDETETVEIDEGVDEGDNDESDVEPEPKAPQAQLGVDDPAAVESFHDLDTPDWLDEGSFYAAADMADDVEEFAELLGWEDDDRLEAMVELLDVDMAVPAGGRA